MNAPSSASSPKPVRRDKRPSLVRALRSAALRRRLYHLFDDPGSDQLGTRVHGVLIALVLITVLIAVLDSVPRINARFGVMFILIEIIALAAFTLEYAARMWVAVEHPPYRSLPPWRARLSYGMTPGALIDLFAILPVFLTMTNIWDVGALAMLRLFRFFKLARYSPGIRSLAEAVYGERRALAASFFILLGAVLIAATLMYMAEAHVQPDKLGTIPDAIYWAVMTLGTVGYGDVVPVTPVGKFIASIVALSGYVMLALPVGIIATAFAQSIQRRDFIVTWSMVARVPLFEQLEAADIAEIMRYLQSQSAEAGEVIVRRGDVARSMYFIATGEVEIELDDRRVRLGEGHFFGEIAVLQRTRRSGTVRAVTQTRLLVLDGADLHSLLDRNPTVARLINEVAKARVENDRVSAHGDISRSELDLGEPSESSRRR